jgi:hypothetical protein
MNLSTILSALPAIGPVAAKTPEFIELFGEMMAVLKPADQDTAKAALADIQADNDEGHRRLQEKLRAAAVR